ncbi:Opsin-5 [Nibea albiflora]|uniref:Opsin-5 n=1 Tax=Nibea albiflora TaxID=240163 RepID=A0ACB7FB72_NIBAL|nr:Opsin-5 [Nibea albiflora]
MPLNSSDDNRTASVFASKLTPAADICVGLTILSVVVLSVLGNGLVLVICYRRRKKMTGSELLCVNLAVVDLLCCICFYPLSILSSFNHAWMGENITCVYYGLGCYIFGLCGMFTIAAISVTRYLKTCYSLVYASLCSAGVSTSPSRTDCPAPSPGGAYHTSAKDAFYVICSFACFTLVPVVLIVVSQGLILHKVSRFTYSLSARGIRNNLRHAERRLSMMFFCISLGFVIAWAPYSVVSFLFIFHKGNWYMAPAGFVFPALFAKSSHVYNPFIYFYFNKTFQQELRCLLLSLWPKLGGNRVGIHIASGHQAPYPIHIQLQERGCVRKKNAVLYQDKTTRKSKSKDKATHANSNHVQGGPVYNCWGSSSNTPTLSVKKPTKASQPVSI